MNEIIMFPFEDFVLQGKYINRYKRKKTNQFTPQIRIKFNIQ